MNLSCKVEGIRGNAECSPPAEEQRLLRRRMDLEMWLLPPAPAWFSLPCGFLHLHLELQRSQAPFPRPLRERSITQDWHTKAIFPFFVICSLDAKSTFTTASSISVNRNKTLQIKNWRQIFSNKSCIGKKKKSLLNQQHWWLLVLPRRAWKEPVPREYGPSTTLGEQPHCVHQDWRENSANTSPGYVSHVKLQLSPK